MGEVNWALGLPQGNPGEAFAQAFHQGQANAQQNRARAAMAALAQDPTNQNALAALAEADPQTAMAYRQQLMEQTKAQLAQHQDAILKGAEIIRQFQPKDQASYSAALQAARMAGVPLDGVPQEYNPQYVDGVMKLADALHPQSGDNMKFITPQPGGGAYGYDPRTGQISTLIQPNDNPALTGQPVQAHGAPPAEAIARLRANPHEAQQFDEIFGPGASQQVLGGQTVAPSGTFHP